MLKGKARAGGGGGGWKERGKGVFVCAFSVRVGDACMHACKAGLPARLLQGACFTVHGIIDDDFSSAVGCCWLLLLLLWMMLQGRVQGKVDRQAGTLELDMGGLSRRLR